MNGWFSEFLDAQITITKMLVKQSDVTVKEIVTFAENALLTSNQMQERGITFLRDVMNVPNKQVSRKTSKKQSTSQKKTARSTSTTAIEKFDKDREGFTE